MTRVPTLETERLVLRGPTIDDVGESTAMWSDPEVMRFLGAPLTEEDVWSRMLRYVGHWEMLGFGLWIVRDKVGAFVGEVGFLEYHRAIVPRLDVPEVGWVLVKSAQGKGYATEAVRAVLEWGEAHFGSTTFTCIIDPDNAASIRLAEKVGFRRQLATTYKGEPTVIFRR